MLIFWDYDTQWGADRSRSSGGAKDWGRLDFENTERLLELHAEHSVPACFAVVGAAALPGQRPYHDPDQIRRIHGAGHEIASHSHRHEWLPGLDPVALRDTLRRSKDALEQCIGAPVVSFVPPYNQPFDYPGGWSFSLSERREVPRQRTDLRRLCEALAETGYQFCRVAYRPMHQRLAEWFLVRRRLDRPAHLEFINGVKCVRVNTPGGFATGTQRVLNACVKAGGLIVAHAHPHSLTVDNTQNERWLVPFLEGVQSLRREGLVEVCKPGDLVRPTLRDEAVRHLI